MKARLYLPAVLLLASAMQAQTGQVYTSNPPSGHSEDGVFIISTTTAAPDIGAKLGSAAATAGFTVFDSADLPLFTVTGTGKVGMGTTAPAEQFHIVKTGTAITRIRVENDNTTAGSALWFTDATAVRGEIGMYGSANTSKGNNTMLFSNNAGGPMIFHFLDPVANAMQEKLRVMPNGRVGIGTNNPTMRLQVSSTTDGEVAVYGVVTATIEANANQGDSAVTGLGYQTVQTGVTNTGYAVGIRGRGALNGPGTLDDAYGALLDVGLTSAGSGVLNAAHGVYVTTLRTAGVGSIANAYGFHVGPLDATTTYGLRVASPLAGATTVTAYGVYIDDQLDAAADWGIYQASDDDANYLNGSVQIGSTATASGVQKLHVYGDAKFEGTVSGGNISAKYQDVAEWVPSTTDLAPGTVVVLNQEKSNEVMISGTAYDTTVAGVVSAQPGLILGEGGAGREQVATTGRVKVRVDASRGPIRVGDLLVTSNLPGTAMKSEPMQIGGRSFHQPGTIIGKALEPLAGGTGEILVLLSMQ